MSCCPPRTIGTIASDPATVPVAAAVGKGATAAVDSRIWCMIPAGAYDVGGEDPDAVPDDGEGPVRRVELSAFRIAETTVTNGEFAAFVADTGYRTDAERFE